MKRPDDTLPGKKNAVLCGVTYGGATQKCLATNRSRSHRAERALRPLPLPYLV